MPHHLPECESFRLSLSGTETVACICGELRACERRLMLRNSEYHYSRECEKVGFDKGLDAARDAVAALPSFSHRRVRVEYACDMVSALAAIDKLKGTL